MPVLGEHAAVAIDAMVCDSEAIPLAGRIKDGGERESAWMIAF